MRRLFLTFAGLAILAPARADEPIKALIVSGDNIAVHDWKGTSKALQEILSEGGKIQADIGAAPGKELTPENLAKYDVLVLNYFPTKDGGPETVWSDENKKAFLDAVKGGKGLVVHHFASAAFANPNWAEFEKAIAGGWRTQGFHGPAHAFTVKKTDVEHPISAGLSSDFAHPVDELYSNSLMVPGSVVLATAYCDPDKPKGTGKDEPVIWVNQYGDGRVCNNVLGHAAEAMADPVYRQWVRRGAEWAATGKVEPAGK